MYKTKVLQAQANAFAHRVQRYTEAHLAIDMVCGFSLYVLLPNGSFVFLSNIGEDALTTILEEGYYLGEYFLSPMYHQHDDFYFQKDIEPLDALHKKLQVSRKKYDFHSCYALFRRCKDCTIIADCYTTKRINQHILFYNNTLPLFENFLSGFLTNFIDVYTDLLPLFKETVFIENQLYKTMMYSQNVPRYPKLSERERSTLYLTANGLNAQQIAEKLAISPHTLNTYKQRILAKLNVNNMTEAVYLSSSEALV